MVRYPGTGRTLAALVAPIGALELAAVLVGATLPVRFALVPAAGQWRTLLSRGGEDDRGELKHLAGANNSQKDVLTI